VEVRVERIVRLKRMGLGVDLGLRTGKERYSRMLCFVGVVVRRGVEVVGIDGGEVVLVGRERIRKGCRSRCSGDVGLRRLRVVGSGSSLRWAVGVVLSRRA
jgi:hypothetical protein